MEKKLISCLKSSILALLICLSLSLPAKAIENIDLLPDRQTPIIDLAKSLSDNQRNNLETSLNEYENKIGKQPERDARGRVAVMVKSIEQGDVTEINLNEISHWGPIRYELVDGQPYWTGTVNYMTNSLFGTFNTEAMALIRNSKVEEWVYTGSLEQVP